MGTISKPSGRGLSLRKRRALVVLLLLGIVGLVALLVLNAFRSNLVFFVTPGQLAEKQVGNGEHFRLGGLVTQGSLKRQGVNVLFTVTDLHHSVRVKYQGILPDLFKEGKGVVAVGSLDATGTFVADEVLAKHDENYMPPEAAAALKAASRPPTATGANP